MKNIQTKTGCDGHGTCYRKKYISKDMRVKPHVRTVRHVTGIRAAGV